MTEVAMETAYVDGYYYSVYLYKQTLKASFVFSFLSFFLQLSILVDLPIIRFISLLLVHPLHEDTEL